ncbi:glycosyltransferase [Cellulomonas terrae]|uniref:GDP-mannose:glycolipid 4-beta-D-mannosyltransferase n=1 Tax=Cellulomonas terrae TaxID=311234 RepID=A0A511JJD5_9CELL|nr:glycosyltransferase [Cellulomonas terrae]GEL98117.1 GDP-mannose:glycolipid 4-beta-D-mannosyltransferase [Cellulomonas terrae]
MTTQTTGARPICVLESFPGPRPTTNPYLVQLLAELPDDVVASTFTWRRALRGRYDVFHVHWPEKLPRGSSRTKTLARQAATAALLLRLRLRRTAVVRTLHNAAPHEAGGRVERVLLRWMDRRTTLFVRLNPATPLPVHAAPGVPVVTIAHAHYRDWFARFPRGEAMPGRVLFFGLIRPYKGVEDLLAAFHDLPDEGASLRVVGHPEDAALGRSVAEQAAADPRIGVRLEYVDDETLAAEINAAQVVVLPYRHLHNSGVALLALSLDRPVLVPAGGTATELAAEVGDAWVPTFTDVVGAADLAAALARTAPGRPDLSARDWSVVAPAHAAAFRTALARVRRETPPAHTPAPARGDR